MFLSDENDIGLCKYILLLMCKYSSLLRKMYDLKKLCEYSTQFYTGKMEEEGFHSITWQQITIKSGNN